MKTFVINIKACFRPVVPEQGAGGAFAPCLFARGGGAKWPFGLIIISKKGDLLHNLKQK